MIDNKVKNCKIYCAGYDFLIKGRFWRGGSIYIYIRMCLQVRGREYGNILSRKYVGNDTPSFPTKSQ